jgi:predicted dehydrogenase
MGRTVGIGLIGVGWMGRVHSAAYRRCRDHFPGCAGAARLVVAADESEERAREAADRLGYERWTTDWRAVIDDPEVEAVSITVPNGLHREVAVAAAEGGKHFWIEKPVGRFPQETGDIAATVEASGVRTLVGFNYRQAPAVQHARQLVESGALGVIDHFRSQWIAAYAASPQGALSWRFLRDQAGLGILGDLGSHAVDLAQFLLGPIASVTARTDTIVRSGRRPGGTHCGHRGWTLAPVENEDVLEHRPVRAAIGTTSRAGRRRAQARYAFEVNGSEWWSRDFERMNERSLPRERWGTQPRLVLMGLQHLPFGRPAGPGLPMGYDDLIEACPSRSSTCSASRAPARRSPQRQ